VCDLIAVDRTELPTPEQERARYLHHNNTPDDAGYVAFLTRFVDVVLREIDDAAIGLDFGCGPAPVLAQLLEQRGVRMAAYDPMFLPDGAALNRSYDLITCTEVAEHAHDPAAFFDTLARLLRPGSTLALMTQLHDDIPDFAAWWYQRDVTHVSFYARRTMEYIAQSHGWSMQMPAADIVLFHRAAAHLPPVQ
jgi:SAM-dependent methyltransferase